MDQHRGAFEYDWRTRFRLSLTAVGRSMSWGESFRLTRILADDPSSQLAAALADWQHPFSRTDMVLADLFDLQHRAKAPKRPQPYPRPWGQKTVKRLGRAAMSPTDARALLQRSARG